LRENYSNHPSSEIINKAITLDDEESIKLYRIKKEYWSDFSSNTNPPYYREPTGITSSNKQHVIKWASERLKNPNMAIEDVSVETCSPRSIINQSELMNNVDVLQVDTEGMDDKVVYSFFKDDIHPPIINIESKHLSNEECGKYSDILSRHGYELYNYTSGEKLALRREMN
jgi:hypothetical protein